MYFKSQWHLHIYFFIEITMEEWIVKIKLGHSLASLHSTCYQSPNSSHFDYRWMCLYIVYHGLLCVAFYNQSRFKPLNATICSLFNLIHQSTSNTLLCQQQFNQIPSVIAIKSSNSCVMSFYKAGWWGILLSLCNFTVLFQVGQMKDDLARVLVDVQVVMVLAEKVIVQEMW